jgi:RNA polymerase sigma-70 factor (ECF subfamily)
MAGDVAPTDAQLVDQTKEGDAAAFDILVRRYYRPAYALALALTNNSADAEDVCQDAFIRAVERLEDCREPAKFSSWLMQIVRHRALNLLDYRRVRAAAPLEPESAESRESPARDAERSELRELLREALERLSPIQREVVLLHDMEGWKHRAIGESLGISEGMSRQHLFAARRLLRAMLGSHT